MFFADHLAFVALWATRQTEKDLRKNKDLYVKTTIRELILYLVFITILCISEWPREKANFLLLHYRKRIFICKMPLFSGRALSALRDEFLSLLLNEKKREKH